MDILCVGLMVADIIVRPVDRMILERDTIAADSITFSTGGDAFNAAISLSKLGVPTGMCGVVGNDPAGSFLVDEARAHEIDTSLVRRSVRNATSTSIVLCEGSGERHFLYSGKCNGELIEDMIPDSFLGETKILYVGSAMALHGMDGTGLTELFRRARRLGVKTVMDATADSEDKWLAKIEGALPYTDVFFPSYEEAVSITGERELSRMARFMSAYGVGTFGVKLAEKGCFITDFKAEHVVAAFPCDAQDVIDTTGAGDAFAAGFLCGMHHGWDLKRCTVFGNAIANFCIRKLGSTTNIPTFQDALAFMQGKKQYPY